MITDHVWRGPVGVRKTPALPCAYMTCRRLRAEHARSVTPRSVHPPRSTRGGR